MTFIEKYKTYRKTAVELNHKMMKTCLNNEALQNSAELLGIAHGDIFLFDTEDEASVLMDFALNEYRVNGKNAIELYREKIGWKNETEKKVLDALLSSYNSLFRIISICERESTLILNDVLNKKEGINLVDIALGKTAVPGLLLFTRLLPFEDFYMTSGISFAFAGDLEGYLLREYRKLSKKVHGSSDSMNRFVSFFVLDKICGIGVRYVNISAPVSS